MRKKGVMSPIIWYIDFLTQNIWSHTWQIDINIWHISTRQTTQYKHKVIYCIFPQHAMAEAIPIMKFAYIRRNTAMLSALSFFLGPAMTKMGYRGVASSRPLKAWSACHQWSPTQGVVFISKQHAINIVDRSWYEQYMGKIRVIRHSYIDCTSLCTCRYPSHNNKGREPEIVQNVCLQIGHTVSCVVMVKLALLFGCTNKDQ